MDPEILSLMLMARSRLPECLCQLGVNNVCTVPDVSQLNWEAQCSF